MEGWVAVYACSADFYNLINHNVCGHMCQIRIRGDCFLLCSQALDEQLDHIGMWLHVSNLGAWGGIDFPSLEGVSGLFQ